MHLENVPAGYLMSALSHSYAQERVADCPGHRVVGELRTRRFRNKDRVFLVCVYPTSREALQSSATLRFDFTRFAEPAISPKTKRVAVNQKLASEIEGVLGEANPDEPLIAPDMLSTAALGVRLREAGICHQMGSALRFLGWRKRGRFYLHDKTQHCLWTRGTVENPRQLANARIAHLLP